mgnify:CR=1 FL=1
MEASADATRIETALVEGAAAVARRGVVLQGVPVVPSSDEADGEREGRGCNPRRILADQTPKKKTNFFIWNL